MCVLFVRVCAPVLIAVVRLIAHRMPALMCVAQIAKMSDDVLPFALDKLVEERRQKREVRCLWCRVLTRLLCQSNNVNDSEVRWRDDHATVC
jgi:hypothetical protein